MPEMNQTIKLEDQDITVKIFECVKKAAEATHAALRAAQKASDAASAIESKDKEKKWHTLQKYLREYGPFINNTTCFTGLYVYAVDINFYDNTGLDALDRQLQTVIGIVYLNEALHSAAKETFKQCLKSLLKKNDLLTDAELRLI